MLILKALLSALVLPVSALAQEHITFPTEDGGVVSADVYGSGERGVVLAQEAVSPRKAGKSRRRSWYTPDFARWPSTSAGAAHGPRSKSGDDGFEHDVLAAVRYLGATGAKTVAVVGASFGGEAAANASIEAEPGEIDRLVLLAAWTDRAPEKIKGRKLFIGARDDANDDGPRLPKIRANYEKAVGPKELIILDGSAHAQFLFATNQGDRLMREILRFLSEP
jgi:pimeloyl-ACP methyl ester carboxylesterase